MLAPATAIGADDLLSAPRAISKSAFARLVGKSPGRISQMIAAGLPVEPDGTIDIARGKIWMQENIDPRRSAAQPQGQLGLDRPIMESGRDRLAREQADNMALKNAALRRELVPSTEVEARWSDILRRVRSKILAVPSRTRQTCPHLTAHDVAAFDAELRQALEELAGLSDA